MRVTIPLISKLNIIESSHYPNQGRTITEKENLRRAKTKTTCRCCCQEAKNA
jgi:hypothetical protein